MYVVHEVFYSLQGEGAWAGQAAVFCRFAGCNLWSGREQDRATALCSFCDTEFRSANGSGGGIFHSASALARYLRTYWPDQTTPARVICTGGEPLLQLDAALIAALHAQHCWIAIETNGTCPIPEHIDWVCTSPKAGAPLVVTCGDELKLVYPQKGIDPSCYLDLEFQWFFLQPLDNADRAHNLAQTIAYCLAHPAWRLSVQIQKWLAIP
jgi:7-carboxy-7-deazaguanine synthase (Cx14CxxC type)